MHHRVADPNHAGQGANYVLERKPIPFTRLALISLIIFTCLLCGSFSLLAALAGSLSDPYAAVRTSLAENNLLTSITAGPTTTPAPRFTNSPSPTPAIFSTAGKAPSLMASVTLNVSGSAGLSGTPTITTAFTGTPSLTATPVRAASASPTATQSPEPGHTASATVKTGGDCDCIEYPEGDPKNLNCTTTSFNSIEDAQACFDFCRLTIGNDIYHLDSNSNGLACEEGLSTPTPTP